MVQNLINLSEIEDTDAEMDPNNQRHIISLYSHASLYPN